MCCGHGEVSGMLKRYDGTNWVDVKAVKRYDGTQWVDCQFVRRWDGSQWIDVWTSTRLIPYIYVNDYSGSTGKGSWSATGLSGTMTLTERDGPGAHRVVGYRTEKVIPVGTQVQFVLDSYNGVGAGEWFGGFVVRINSGGEILIPSIEIQWSHPEDGSTLSWTTEHEGYIGFGVNNSIGSDDPVSMNLSATVSNVKIDSSSAFFLHGMRDNVAWMYVILAYAGVALVILALVGANRD